MLRPASLSAGLLAACLLAAVLAAPEARAQARQANQAQDNQAQDPGALADQILGLPALPDADHPAWRAVGRVNSEGAAQIWGCSGTLVAPGLVLTAAHCVADAKGLARPPEKVHFISGWLNGGFDAEAVARSVEVHPRFGQTEGLERIAHDMALIRLAQPMPDRIAPIPVSPLEQADRAYGVVGYMNAAPQSLRAGFDCARLPDLGRLMTVACPVENGQSGSPLLQEGPEGWRVVGVVTAQNGPAWHRRAQVTRIDHWLLERLRAP